MEKTMNMINCPRCSGEMRIPDYEEGGTMPCPECEGEGEIEDVIKDNEENK